MTSNRQRSRAISLCVAILLLSSATAASAQESELSEPLQPLLMEVSLNGQHQPEPVILLRAPGGALYVGEAALHAWRLILPSTETISFEGETYRRLDGIPSVSLDLRQADQSIRIEAAPSLFQTQRVAFGSRGVLEMTPSAAGAFLNYDLFLEHSRGKTGINGALELGGFTPHGVGVSSFVGRAASGRARLLRLETSWTIDRPERLSSIRIGDSISRGGYGAAPVRFAGFQFARNFAVQPGFITLPLPTIEGSAALPSVAEVYVNSVLQGSGAVDPGPFEMRQTPVQTGGGNVQLVTRDLLGREIVTTQRYYASAEMLRRGLHDFSYELGVMREDFGIRSNRYGGLMASATHRYGVSDRLTAEVSAQVTEARQTAGAALTGTVFDLALVSASAAYSRSDRDSGTALGFGVERRSASFSAGIRTEIRTRGYAAIGEVDERRARLITYAFADLSLRRGAIGINYFRRDHRAGEDEELIGGFVSLAVGRRGTLQVYARRAASGRAQTVVGAYLGLAIGGRRSAAASVESEQGRVLARFSFQEDPPPGNGSGYRATAEVGAVDAVNAQYVYQASTATYGVELARTGSTSGVRLSMAGSVGLLGGQVFASRRLGSSFAAVQVGDYSGVRVYADNQLVGVTGRGGRLIVPSLRAFEPNPIRIDDSDLPMDAQLSAFDTSVRPYARAGVIVRFSPRRERGVLLRVRLPDGGLLPAGAEVTVEGRGESYVAATGGEVYVPGLTGVARLRARWGGRACRFTAAVPANDDPQPLLDGLVCVEGGYAAR